MNRSLTNARSIIVLRISETIASFLIMFLIMLLSIPAKGDKPVNEGINVNVGAGNGKDSVVIISGTVIEAASGLAIPGVSVFIKGTSNGTTTDADGRYTIEANDGDILVFTSVGFKNKEVALNGQTNISVGMEEDVATLSAVVVNGGYYSTSLENRTGNIVKVLGEDIREQPITSPLLGIQGRITGVDVTPTTGMPGGGINIKIRGQNSFRFDGGYPLYVIDGVPMDPTPIKSSSYMMDGVYDPLSTINPANIESIEILKDADATAIYGSRGGNGVVLITTKRASAGKTSADVSIYRGIGEISKKMDLLSTSQYLAMRREAFRNNGNELINLYNAPDLVRWDTTRFTDWQDVLMGNTADVVDFQGNLSGGNATTSFHLGGGYHEETLVFPGDFGAKRVNGSLSLNHASYDSRFKVSATINYGITTNRFFDNLYTVGDALSLSPNAPSLYNADGSLNWQPDENGWATWANPLAAFRNTNDSESQSIIFNGILSYNVANLFIVKANLGYTDVGASETLKAPVSAFDPMLAPYLTPSAIFSDTDRKSWIIEPQLIFSRKFDGHNVDILFGTTWQDGSSEYMSINASGFSSDALMGSLRSATNVLIASDNNSTYRYVSGFARIGYDWKEKYFINVTARRDGSSRFGADNRFGNFGAVGAAWIFTKENIFGDNSSVVSFGKFRGSYGVTGNDQIGDYRYLNTYTTTSEKYHGAYGLIPTSLYNANYKWEVNKKLEAALEIALLRNRISFEVAWYRNRSSNQLTEYQLPGTSGLGSVLKNLDATIENKGLEILLNLRTIDTEHFKWITSVNFSNPRNRLLRFDNIENSPYADVYIVGESLSSMRLYSMTGVDPQTGLYNFRDFDENGVINDEDRLIVRDVGRRYFGGINNAVSYKGFELSFLVQFVKGNAQSFLTRRPPGQMVNLPSYIYDGRWRQPGDVASYQMLSSGYGTYSTYSMNLMSDNNIESTSFMRLKTVSLAYSLKQHLVSRIGLQRCRFFLQGQNTFTITNFGGLDPETGSVVAPPLRMFSIGVQVGI